MVWTMLQLTYMGTNNCSGVDHIVVLYMGTNSWYNVDHVAVHGALTASMLWTILWA